jgi:hypothetical protein
MERARPGKELLEVVLLIPLFAALAAIHHCYYVLQFALLVEVALILVRACIPVAFQIVVVAMRKLIALLFFLVGPS